jgi:hypothetical protein
VEQQQQWKGSNGSIISQGIADAVAIYRKMRNTSNSDSLAASHIRNANQAIRTGSKRAINPPAAPSLEFISKYLTVPVDVYIRFTLFSIEQSAKRVKSCS